MSSPSSTHLSPRTSSLPLSIVLAAMASFSTILLGMGQRDLLLPVLTLLAAGTSVAFTDAFRWFHLPHILANVAMVLAAIFSLSGFLGSSSHEQLQAIAKLLTYVQIVLLFQPKSVRIYGQLIIFSLLQVVVAALLNDSLEFGLLLIVYMIVTVAGVALFFVFREVGRAGAVTPSRRSFFRRAVAQEQDASSVSRHRAPTLAMVDSRTALQAGVLSRHVIPPLLGLVTVMLLFTVVFFYAIPRTGGANWESGTGVRSVVGFAPEISFEDMGRLLSSDARVMRVNFANIKSGEIYTIIGEPYFRGTALTKYLTAGGRGQWRQEVEFGSAAGIPLESPPNARDLVRQDVLLDPTGSSQLFSVYPAYAIAETSEMLRVGARTSRLHRVGFLRRDLYDEFRFSVATTAFRFGAQFQVSPDPNRLTTPQDEVQMERRNMRLQFLDSRDQFPQLISLANRIVQKATRRGNAFEKARALEAYFLEKDRYTYSIDFDDINKHRNFALDPLEDFAVNHRRGHCEYFASALTLMLRSQGIPARMIVGYKGGEFNYVGNYFVVRQRDAHAWVEAYVKPEEIPVDAICPEERHAGGGWLRLDPTPSVDTSEQVDQRSVVDRVGKSLDYARWLWSDYVLRLTSGRQQAAILRPLALDQELPLAGLIDTDAWRNLVQRAAGLDSRDDAPSGFRWFGGSAALIALGLLYGLYQLVRFVGPRLAQTARLRRALTARGPCATIAFYQRLELILGRVGLHRGPGQTQREFARQAARHLAATPDHASASAIPEAVVQAFYQVRFGDATLDPQQDAAVTAQLEQLERLLSAGLHLPSAVTGNGSPRGLSV